LFTIKLHIISYCLCSVDIFGPADLAADYARGMPEVQEK